ncbi:hypothetical protein BP00DRAFT_425792 [Aspergillus indologenus CBS 114.80]|uniref:Uncharacterized protein n=1 Tax=Aspergillus indologenus CBS 114.80 TaxID=1450541 RepID=A0A2V5I2X9_9EURO|nr:hypothetical protein BP00DRAFT_425792 [Aspergillus indologenus CBS 114.80]
MAAAKLREYASWKAYLESFKCHPHQMPQSTFAPARYFQLLVNDTSSDDFVPDVTFTPVAHRTRGKTTALARQMADVYFQTPTRYKRQEGTGNSLGFEEDSSDEEQPFASGTPEETPGPSEILKQMYKPTKDEEIVTAALSTFLVGLTIHFAISSRWTVHRKAFKADFSHASFEARIDGYLEDGSTAKVRTLIEVKPVLRRIKRALINMQEAAQMVAWIKSDPDLDGSLNKTGRRLHVSQNRHEVFLIFAEYDQDYLDYLDNKPTPGTGVHFLTMHEYGPWDITSSSQMSELGTILLAIALRAHSDLREEERRRK